MWALHDLSLLILMRLYQQETNHSGTNFKKRLRGGCWTNPSFPYSLSFPPLYHPPLHSSEFCNVYLVCCIHLLITLCDLPAQLKYANTVLVAMQCQSELLFAITQHTVIIYLRCPPFISFIVLFGYSGRLFQQLCVGHGGTTVHLHMLRRTNEGKWQLNSPPTPTRKLFKPTIKSFPFFYCSLPLLTYPSPTLPPYSLSFFFSTTSIQQITQRDIMSSAYISIFTSNTAGHNGLVCQH